MQWASRVKPGLIRRLYRLDRDGVYDDALLDRAGWGLHARCRDVLTVCRAVLEGEVPCPECGSTVHRQRHAERARSSRQRPPLAFTCAHCGDAVTWDGCKNALRQQPKCFDCLRPLDWTYAEGELACPACARGWSWQAYRQSVSRRLWLPCPRCGRKVRRPEQAPVADSSVRFPSETVECPKCGLEALHARGKLSCPHCGHEIAWRTYRKRQKRRAERLRCSSCGHEFTWQSWRENYRHEPLLTGNPAPLRKFIAGWERSRTAQRKMACIDSLLHAVHGRGALGPLLIEGDEPSVVGLLDELAEQR